MSKIVYIICESCGKKIRADCYNKSSNIYKRMFAESVCYDCAYWLEIIENMPETYEIIDGVCYDFQPFCPKEKAKTANLGSNGKRMYILKNDGSVKMSNDVWDKGHVPKQFLDKLKDTAIFIPREVYEPLTIRKATCENKGCYDRYHCFFYDFRIEYDKGPFNKIPKDWITGNEYCRAFANIAKIRGFNPTIDSIHFLDLLKQRENEKIPVPERDNG